MKELPDVTAVAVSQTLHFVLHPPKALDVHWLIAGDECASSSVSSYRRRGSIRNSSSYPSRLQTPIATSHSSSPLARTNKQFNGQHSRSQSLTSASDFANKKTTDATTKSPSSHRRTGSTAIGHAVYEEPQTTPNRKTSSFTDLASSTFAYFTGFSINGNQEIRDNEGEESGREVTEKKDVQLQEEEDIASGREDDQSSELSHPIAIELGSIEPDTPRSSIDTQSTYIPREPDSRRSSIDSTASFATNTHSNHLGTHRLNFMMKSTSTPSLLHKSEHLLWGFAQIVGHFVADPAMINASEFSQLKTRTMYRPGGGFGGGGGMLGRPSGTRSQSRIDTNSIPVFSTPPSILFVDLKLLPGESKSYLYKLTLPKDIPPSHKGRCIRFNYHLVIGTQRSSSNNSSSTNTGMGRGHVVHLPFRVLNHVSPDGSRPIYDLMNPVVTYQDEAKVEQVDTNEVQSSKSLPLPVKQTVEARHANITSFGLLENNKNRKDFLSYVEELIATSSLSASKRQNSTDSTTSTSTLASLPPNSEITRRVSEVYEEESEQTKGEPKRSSYINKDGIIEYTPDKNCAQLVSDIVRAGHKGKWAYTEPLIFNIITRKVNPTV
ncbi:hypothetical protein NQZ79_g2811 [Umbelopsis isabellina]|nr:hypothetical protein NQZ79_g2811 [Umbelopsis isabellina]